MFKKICKGCARVATAGLVGLVVARFFQKRHEPERKPLFRRLIVH